MTNEAYAKAERIQKNISELGKLRHIACQSYKRYFLVKKFLWISDYDKRQVCLCDDGLTEVIREYCDKRIRELREELKAL